MSISKNVLTITDSSGTVTGMSYVANSAVVSAGQDFKLPPTVTQSGRVFTLTFYANRKKTTAVADSFNTSSGGTAFEYAASGGGGTPDQLNFYFTVQINFETAQGTGTTLLNVGQGHYATTNNWWLGGSAVTSSVPSLDVPVANGAYTLVLPLSGDHDSFKFGPGTVRQ